MNVGSNTDMASTLSPRRSSMNEKRVSFDIEDSFNGGLKDSNTDYVDKHKPGFSSSKNSIVVSDVLKTLFFILVWYTFSTFLTL